MATHKSAIKASRQSEKRNLRNRSIRSMVKNSIKKVEKLVNEKDLDNAKLFFRNAESIIMKAVTKKVLKLNNASRKVSSLSHKVKSLEPRT